jgi:hypothetical protein
MNGNRRQALLLGLLGVSVLAVLWFKGGLVVASGEVDTLPPIDLGGLDVKLKEISTVDPQMFPEGRPEARPDRNLFQYGVPKPPPVDPAEVERQRIAAQQALQAEEARARALKAQQEEAARLAALSPPPQIVQATPPPPEPPREPPKPTPPPIKFRFMGMMGPAKKTLAVFLDADNILLARKGEVIQGKFRVIEIGVEWADIGYVDPIFKDQKKRLQFGQ